MTHQKLAKRIVSDHELVTIGDASREFVATSNPFEMAKHIGRIADLDRTASIDQRMDVIRRKLLDPSLHPAIQDIALVVGGDVTLHIAAQALDMEPFLTYEQIVKPLAGSVVLNHAKLSFSSELDDYMMAGEDEAARYLYELGREASIVKPLNWRAIQLSYAVSRGVRKIVGRS
jgi:hypothetical protein